uniref:Phospholipid-transporting ATPase IA (Trinotate prediction) n=1 Tax=Henneguya salminicola TaxID=69463 RepID=A0A6G3MH07_HENSL
MFSSQIIFSKVHITLYNVFYSSLPPFCFGLLDQSCSLEAQYNVPYLYESIRRSSPFSIKRFYAWLLNGVLHSSLIFFLCYALCRRGVINIDGNPISSALFGNVVFTLTLIVITLKAALELRYWFWMTHIGICGGFFSYIVFMSIFSRRLPPLIWFEPEFLDSDILMYESPLFWLGLGIPIIVMLPDFIFHWF